MTGVIASPHPCEPETKYTEQVSTRGETARVYNAIQTGFVDSLAACVCPCISIAQVASSVGVSYLLTLLGFGLLNLLGLASMMIGASYVDMWYMRRKDYGYLVLLEVVMYWIGPFFSVLLMVLLCLIVGEVDGGINVLAIVLPGVAMDMVFACSAQAFRSKSDKQIGEPTASTWRTVVNTICCVTCSLAAATTRVKKHKGAAECDLGPMDGNLGPLDTLPSYQP
ncbi:hypothetical protein Poli38472_004989 [Pythium oligandrum]|uniref:Transmembrane protein n=1 Tax=Pythium oligandrum TaxID=41045 RepID=A0A8K1CB81_PYTOL|nr:hypothetical protein Poli38472_004989 [Pythium oligandrum]|eukprot:TMW59920.1 hypothetical protein Poli38472_004989 [Pythium oligandrum]